MKNSDGCLRKNRKGRENEEFWDYIERTSDEVTETYPDWKKGGKEAAERRRRENSGKE